MFQTPPSLETINVSNAGTDTLLPHYISTRSSPAWSVQIGDDQYPPQPAQSQGPHGVSDFVDGSGPIFSMYLEMATEEDQKMVENWKADADGILIFVRLSLLV